MMVLMNEGLIYLVLLVGGLTLGSFAGAMVWRLRARQLRLDIAVGEKITATEKREVAKIKQRSALRDRSVCLHCGHELHWYDLIPIFSWVSLAGRCRYCRQRIGWFEPLMELGVAAFFILSYAFWPGALTAPLEIARFGIWLIAGVGMAILFAYDARWFLLPNRVVFPLIGLGFANALLVIIGDGFAWATILSILCACAVLSGLYYVIYVFSGQRWVGFGDVKLGLALALLLADWRLAVVALFLANLIGTLLLLPLLLLHKVKRQAHVPFGPLLITGWAIAGLFGADIIRFYVALALGV